MERQICDHKTLKMRQVAVDPEFQSKKIGSQLIQFSEEFAVGKGFSIIELHARKTAFDFYQKLKYHCISDEFLEVGIPHYKMKKTILS